MKHSLALALALLAHSACAPSTLPGPPTTIGPLPIASMSEGEDPAGSLIADLGSIHLVTRVEASFTEAAQAYSLGTSTDGEDYQPYEAGERLARYVRLEPRTPGERLSRLSELLVFGETTAPSPSSSPPANPAPASALLLDRFDRPDGLITNEYAYRHPGEPGAVRSATWELTSGSLFARGGVAWSGIPDGDRPDASSLLANNSAVLRARTHRDDLGDTAIGFRLRNLGLRTTAETPAQSYDGVHAWTRYVSEESLYAVTINRRDDLAVIKKKVPGGPSNGGTYHTLASAPYAVPYGAWQAVRITTRNNADGSVTIALFTDGVERLRATDQGQGGPPITAPGRVGVRGDNCELELDDFEVQAI